MLEQQMNDSEGDDFVDVDSDSDSDMEIAPREANNQPSKKNASKLAAKQHERELLEKMRQAYAQNSDPVDLEEDEAYCEACNLKIRGDMNISVLEWKESKSRHISRLRVICLV